MKLEVQNPICIERRLEVPQSEWEIPPRVVQNDTTEKHPDPVKLVMANQPHTVLVDKLQKKTVVGDVAVPTRMREHEKLKKHQGMKGEKETFCRVYNSLC